MNFQCKNCGGNMVYSPKVKAMYCPYCEGTDCESVAGDASLTVCASCGGELSVDKFDSSGKCPYCGNYLVYNDRVSGEYLPDSVIPFKLTKDEAVESMDKEFKRRKFAPISFLNEKTLENLKGYYVPFFLYDFTADYDYLGEGTKVRTWRSGNYDYTETSYFEIVRKMHAEYDNIPADASYVMEDNTMDLLEPFDYNELMEFDPKYLSGFFGSIYNDKSDTFKPRAVIKATNSAKALMRDSIKGYATVKAEVDDLRFQDGKVDYTLFPVWKYVFKWAGKEYPFYVNGQNGKVIGKVPISKLKVIIYSLVSGGLLLAGIEFILKLMEVLL